MATYTPAALLIASVAAFACLNVPVSFAQSAPGGGEATTQRSALSEKEKIERLIKGVEQAKDLKFIRNGTEHTAAEAGEHMRRKLKAAGDRVTTAEIFIEKVASKSESSGKPYEIKTADGKTVKAGEYLRARLAEIEAGQ